MGAGAVRDGARCRGGPGTTPRTAVIVGFRSVGALKGLGVGLVLCQLTIGCSQRYVTAGGTQRVPKSVRPAR